MLPLLSSALSASSDPAIFESIVGSPLSVRVNFPEVCTLLTDVAILESFSASLLSAAVCIGDFT